MIKIYPNNFECYRKKTESVYRAKSLYNQQIVALSNDADYSLNSIEEYTSWTSSDMYGFQESSIWLV